jgi:hypothetical protein
VAIREVASCARETCLLSPLRKTLYGALGKSSLIKDNILCLQSVDNCQLIGDSMPASYIVPVRIA